MVCVCVRRYRSPVSHLARCLLIRFHHSNNQFWVSECAFHSKANENSGESSAVFTKDCFFFFGLIYGIFTLFTWIDYVNDNPHNLVTSCYLNVLDHCGE